LKGEWGVWVKGQWGRGEGEKRKGGECDRGGERVLGGMRDAVWLPGENQGISREKEEEDVKRAPQPQGVELVEMNCADGHGRLGPRTEIKKKKGKEKNHHFVPIPQRFCTVEIITLRRSGTDKDSDN